MPQTPRKPKAKKKPTVRTTATRPPNIEWAKNPNWTWKLVTYLTDHPIFRKKLFSDSTADANKEGRAKAVAKDGRPQQYATLAQAIFETDREQGPEYAKAQGRFQTSVETRLRRLKKDYIYYVKELGSTGAGLDPADVTPGSEMDNLVASIVEVWPWWKEFHSFWRELPNYNPIAVETSEPGVDHAAAAATLFEPSHTDQGGEVASPGPGATPTEPSEPEDVAVNQEGDEHGETEHGETEHGETEHAETEHDDPEDRMSEPAEDEPPRRTKRSSAYLLESDEDEPPRRAGGRSTYPPVPPPTKSVTSSKKIVTGRDAGLAKAQTTKLGPKNAIDKFNDTRQREADRLANRERMIHNQRMAVAANKKLKYEINRMKLTAQQEALAADREARREELQIQLEIARLNAQAATSAHSAPSRIDQGSPSMANPTPTPTHPLPVSSSASAIAPGRQPRTSYHATSASGMRYRDTDYGDGGMASTSSGYDGDMNGTSSAYDGDMTGTSSGYGGSMAGSTNGYEDMNYSGGTWEM